jgi:hypothetical protein
LRKTAEKARDEAVEGGRVARERRLEAEALAQRHDRDSVHGNLAAHEDDVTGTRALWRDHDARRHEADAADVDEDAVALAAVHDLRVARDDRDARAGGGRLHRGDDAREVAEGEALLEDEAGRERERLRAAHREVVHRAVHGERADVAAREEKRADDERIRRERETRATNLEDRAVMQLAERRVVEALEEDVLDQALRHPAPAAVREENRLSLAGRNRAARREQRRAGVAGRVLRAHVELTSALA